ICGKQVDTLRARAVGIFGGVTYYFCSAECKSKFKDPRQASGPPPLVERRKPEPARDEPLEREERKPDLSGSRGEEVRYARSRIRRITGEVGTPVVQIDLRPDGKKPPEQSSKDLETISDYPPKSSSGVWVTLVIVMLLLAGGVVYFTMFKK